MYRVDCHVPGPVLRRMSVNLTDCLTYLMTLKELADRLAGSWSLEHCVFKEVAGW